MSKNLFLLSLGVISASIYFTGCGGSDFAEKFDSAPVVVKTAFNSQPTQYIHYTNEKKLKDYAVNPNGEISNINLIFNSPITSDTNQGSTLINLKIDEHAGGQFVYTWDKLNRKYYWAVRKILSKYTSEDQETDALTKALPKDPNDPLRRMFSTTENDRFFVADLYSKSNGTESDQVLSMCNNLADNLIQSPMSLKFNIKKSNNYIYLTNVVGTYKGQTKDLPDFNLASSTKTLEANLLDLFPYFAEFSKMF